MKKIVVISDTHSNRAAIEKLYPIFSECDLIIHLGDTSSDGSRIRSAFPGKTILINGNCDFPRLGEDEKIIEVEDIKIFACHGDRYRVKSGLSRLAERAAQEGARIALYGHTHKSLEREENDVFMINPGALSRTAHEKSYLYLVVYGDKFTSKIVQISP